MPYIQRDEAGEIVGQFENLQPGCAEEWAEDWTLPTPDWSATIASTRFSHEVAGTVILGFHVHTDRTTQAKLTASAVRSGRDSSYSVNWKMSDGTFVLLQQEALFSIADGVGDYVQACYTREAELVSALSAGTFKEAMLLEGWPE